MNLAMLKHDTNKILWTASDIILPKALWERLEEQGYKVQVAETQANVMDEITKQYPRLWIGQVNGDAEAGLSHLQQIRSAYPELPIIIMSPQPSIEEAVDVIKGIKDVHRHPHVAGPGGNQNIFLLQLFDTG